MEFTAKTISKEEVPQGLLFTVEFTNGTKTFIETVIPQDETGLLQWVESRLTSLNSISTLSVKYLDNGVIMTVIPAIVLTEAQVNTAAYYDARNNLLEAKADLDMTLITKAEFDSLVVGVKDKKIKAGK